MLANLGLGALGSSGWGAVAQGSQGSLSSPPDVLSSFQPVSNSDGQTASSYPVISAKLGDQTSFFGKSRDMHLHAILHKSETHLHPFTCFSGEIQEAQTQCV